LFSNSNLPRAAIAVACQESDVRHVKALIIGPPETPYEYGFFEFAVKFGTEYPSKPPKVDAKTTNGGRCRFNPNIYAQGKVCLSILGTWNGEKPGEEWSSAQGLESILISIQSLMSNNPYENEPGFENARSASDEKNQSSYREKVFASQAAFSSLLSNSF
jgi:ubiquitin-conjugating enzyme E2 Z